MLVKEYGIKWMAWEKPSSGGKGLTKFSDQEKENKSSCGNERARKMIS